MNDGSKLISEKSDAFVENIDTCKSKRVRARDMVFNATFNNISVISWRSVLLVGKNHRPAASRSQL
jgi:hypothetical protein